MQTNGTQKVTLINSSKDPQKPVLRERTDRAWFSCLLQHLARKWSSCNCILSTLEPAWYIASDWENILQEQMGMGRMS